MPKLKKKSKSKFSKISKKQVIPMVAFVAIAAIALTYISHRNHALAYTVILSKGSNRALNEGTNPLYITDNAAHGYSYTTVRRGTV